MPSSEKITILLADEDALRRDGLAAVLQGRADFEVIAQCPDGETALNQIRQMRPDVAIVDLNLPKVHGIELVRRVRGETLGTKVVILSGTADDDIVREVVRAGGDAYLLKNGPARHLIDAISYVRDGGQYFSPQLRRAGLDRRLLEEPPRVPTESPAAREEVSDAVRNESLPASPRVARDSRYGRRRGNDRMADPNTLRARLREDAGSSNLEDRDYEILNMMADGIRPLLERLDEIDGRVGEMETGATPVPGNVRRWLDTEIADTFVDPRASGKETVSALSLNDLEARLPQLIEQAVTSRFANMASKLHQEIEETHVRTLETFVKNIQVKLVQRVSALESDMSKQAEAMLQLREYSQRTEDNLSRLISGVDRLAQDLPKRLAAPYAPAPVAEANAEELPRPIDSRPIKEIRRKRRKSSGSSRVKIFWLAVAALIVIVVAVTQLPKLSRNNSTDRNALAPSATNSAGSQAPAPKPIAPPQAGADTTTKMLAAQQYMDRKDYSMAEDIYKQVLKTEPSNVDALKALASVLYREDKIEESAAVLDKLPKTN